MIFITKLIDFIKSLFIKKEKMIEPIKNPMSIKPPDITLLEVNDIAKIKVIYPKLRPLFINFLIDCKNAGLKCGIFSSVRTFKEQDELYAQGRTKPGAIVTNAKAGYSYHNYGLSCDIVFKNSKGNWTWSSNQWSQLGNLGIKDGLEWGGSWTSLTDRPHFQKTFKPSNLTEIQWFNKLRGIYLKTNKIEDAWGYLDSLA